jgi:hypothetical protein
MKYFPLLILLFATAVARGSIESLGFSHQFAKSVSGEYRWYEDFPGEGFPAGQWHTATSPTFLLNHLQNTLPPQTFIYQQAAPLPDQPLAEWTTTAPSIDYRFEVLEWTATPAEGGGLASLRQNFKISGLSSASPQYLNIHLDFVTTGGMIVNFSGWYFMDPSGFPLPEQPSQGSILPAGHYILDSFLSNPGTYSLSLTPADADTDGDGLSDEDELVIHHTDPTTADTDADGFLDGFEILSGKLPLDPLSFPAEQLIIRPAVELRVSTKLGTTYRIQSSPDLQTWVDTETIIEGTGQEVRRIFESIDDLAKYWRVREEE